MPPAHCAGPRQTGSRRPGGRGLLTALQGTWTDGLCRAGRSTSNAPASHIPCPQRGPNSAAVGEPEGGSRGPGLCKAEEAESQAGLPTCPVTGRWLLKQTFGVFLVTGKPFILCNTGRTSRGGGGLRGLDRTALGDDRGQVLSFLVPWLCSLPYCSTEEHLLSLLPAPPSPQKRCFGRIA